MKHLFQSRDMEKGREGMEGMGGRERGGRERERKWWKGRRSGKREMLGFSVPSDFTHAFVSC
jgi:hypothetical protein